MTRLQELQDELKEVEKQIDLMIAWTPRSIALKDLREERLELKDKIKYLQEYN